MIQASDPAALQHALALVLLARSDPGACDALLSGLGDGEVRQAAYYLTAMAARWSRRWPDGELRRLTLELGGAA